MTQKYKIHQCSKVVENKVYSVIWLAACSNLTLRLLPLQSFSKSALLSEYQLHCVGLTGHEQNEMLKSGGLNRPYSQLNVVPQTAC